MTATDMSEMEKVGYDDQSFRGNIYMLTQHAAGQSRARTIRRIDPIDYLAKTLLLE